MVKRIIHVDIPPSRAADLYPALGAISDTCHGNWFCQQNPNGKGHFVRIETQDYAAWDSALAKLTGVTIFPHALSGKKIGDGAKYFGSDITPSQTIYEALESLAKATGNHGFHPDNL